MAFRKIIRCGLLFNKWSAMMKMDVRLLLTVQKKLECFFFLTFRDAHFRMAANHPSQHNASNLFFGHRYGKLILD